MIDPQTISDIMSELGCTDPLEQFQLGLIIASLKISNLIELS